MLETSKKLENLIDTNKPTLLTGDFNVCFNQKRHNPITEKLESLGFKQIVTKATHIQGGLIDHAYWLDSDLIWSEPNLEMYSPYYSDHDCILVTLKKISL